MTSFSVDPKKLEELLTYCVNFAKQMLTSHQEFHPFGATIDSVGAFKAVGGWNGEEFPKGQDLANVLITAFKKEFSEGTICAAALAANVNIPLRFNPPFPDGIRVTLECVGYSRNIYVPYRIKKRGLLDKIMSRSFSIDYAEFISGDVPPSLRAT